MCDVYCSDCGVTLAVAETTIADLRDRLLLFKRFVCVECGCAPRVGALHCDDCLCLEQCTAPRGLEDGWTPAKHIFAACVSVGMRALAGRKLKGG